MGVAVLGLKVLVFGNEKDAVAGGNAEEGNETDDGRDADRFLQFEGDRAR